MKTMCPSGYPHKIFVATHALGHIITITSVATKQLCITRRAHCFLDRIYISLILLQWGLSIRGFVCSGSLIDTYIINTHTYINIYILHVYIRIYYIYIYIYMCVCVGVCVCVRAHARARVCVCVCVCVCGDTHISIYL